MYFPAIVKDCRKFDYTNKKGDSCSAYSVTVQLENFETYSVVSKESLKEGASCAFVISAGSFNKPFCSVNKLPKAA